MCVLLVRKKITYVLSYSPKNFSPHVMIEQEMWLTLVKGEASSSTRRRQVAPAAQRTFFSQAVFHPRHRIWLLCWRKTFGVEMFLFISHRKMTSYFGSALGLSAGINSKNILFFNLQQKYSEFLKLFLLQNSGMILKEKHCSHVATKDLICKVLSSTLSDHYITSWDH